MKEALVNYSRRVIANSANDSPREFEGVVPELVTEIQKNILVPRTTQTNLEPFRERFGFELPDDI
ncbi:MAG: hypothetical protein IJ071_12370, partial [Ruminococcus sp.]|nr:hypothetical protein [Ruminococcus sp.]